MIQLKSIFFFLFFAFAISLIAKKNIKYTLPTTFFLCVIVSIVLGYFNVLKWSVYFFELIAVVGFFLLFLEIFRRKKNISLVINYYTLFYLLFSIIVLFLNSKFKLWEWDAFTHWAITVKNMFFTNTLSTNELSNIIMKNYPPAISLIQYIYVSIVGVFKDEYLINALLIFSFTLLFPFFHLISKKNLFIKIIMFLFVFLMPLSVFSNYYNSVYVDAVVGLLFGFIMICYYIIPYSKYKNALLCLALVTLVLTKQICIILSGLFIIIYIFDSIRTFLITKKTIALKLEIKTFVLFLCVVLITFLSWNIHVSSNVQSSSSMVNQMYSVIETIISGETNYIISFYKSLINYLNNYFLTGNLIKFSYLHLLLFQICALIFIDLFCRKKSKDNFKRIAFHIIFINILYVFLLSIFMLTFFSEREVSNLASVERYLGSIMLSGIYIVSYFVLRNGMNKHILFIFLIYFLLLGNYNSFVNNIIFRSELKNNNSICRSSYLNIHKILPYVKDGEKVYLIAQTDDGFAFHLSRYEATPILFNTNNWAVGSNVLENNIYVNNNTNLNEFSNILYLEYEYVYLYNINDDFIEEFKSIFNSEILESSLYFINKTNEDISLELVDID